MVAFHPVIATSCLVLLVAFRPQDAIVHLAVVAIRTPQEEEKETHLVVDVHQQAIREIF